jgi:hypothetical protein
VPTHYERGRSAENYVKRKLLKAGASIVVRSGRSLTPFDLIGFFPSTREIFLIQVKASKKGLKLLDVAKKYGEMKDYNGHWTVKTGLFVRSKIGWVSNISSLVEKLIEPTSTAI